MASERSAWVLKKANSKSGADLCIGPNVEAKEYERILHRALNEGGWVAQQRIAVRRETFPICEAGGMVARDMLVDFAPYIFRGRLAGYLTRLSASGLANVTSGGGQVPAFVISQNVERRT